MLFLSGCISEIMEEPFIQDADNYEAEEIRTSSKGKIFIRGVDPDNQSYTKAWISSQNQSLIERPAVIKTGKSYGIPVLPIQDFNL